MATVTLTPSNYYQCQNNYVTEKNPSKKYVRYNSTGPVDDYVLIEFNLPTNLKHVRVTDNKVNVSGTGADMSYTCRTPYDSIDGTVTVGSRVSNYGSILSKETSGSSATHELWFPLSNLKSTKFYVIIGATYTGYKNDYYFTSCSLVLSYTTDNPQPTLTLSPNSGFADPNKAHTFQVTLGSVSRILMQYSISSSILYYRKNGSGSYTSRQFTSATSVNVPANTFDGASNYQIYAKSTLDDSTSVQSSVGTISTQDATPTVTPISPSNEVLYGSATFKWNYEISTGTPQYAYEISYKRDSNAWEYPTGKVISSSNTVTLSLPNAGTYLWSVRAYNQDNVASSWSSQATFINVAPPSAPTIIDIQTVNRPTVKWTSNSQAAYEVRFLKDGEMIYDSGQIYSTGGIYQANEYFQDGFYTVQVAIINSFGRMSDWSSVEFSIQSDLTAPDFSVIPGNGNTIVIETSSVFSEYYIKRNGVLIGKTESGIYSDQFANGLVEYTIIGVTTDDRSAFTTKTVNNSVTSNMLIAKDGTTYLVNRRINTPVGVQFQKTAVYDMAEFIGASLPEHHFAKMREGRFTVTFKDYVNTDRLLGEKMFYADMYGNGAWVAIVSIGRTESRYGNETTAELQLTAVDEEIDYA